MDQLWTNFPFFLKKKTQINLKHLIWPKKHFETSLFFSYICWAETLLSHYHGRMWGLNFYDGLLKSHLATVRWPISYRIRFLTNRSILIFFSLMENYINFFFNPSLRYENNRKNEGDLKSEDNWISFLYSIYCLPTLIETKTKDFHSLSDSFPSLTFVLVNILGN